MHLEVTTPDQNTQAPAPCVESPDITSITRMAREQARSVLVKLPLLGPVTWLMMQQASTRHTLLSELEWRVMPPLVCRQAKLYMRDEAPIAYASWAKLSPQAALRYRSSPHQLAPADWKSGSDIWLVDLFTPFCGAQDVLADLREKVFPRQAIHQLAPAHTQGEPAQVISWPAL